MLILPDAHMASICAGVFLGWQRCRGLWKDWSRPSVDWSRCLQGYTGLLGTVGKLTVSAEVGPPTVVITDLYVGQLILSPSYSSHELFLSTLTPLLLPLYVTVTLTRCKRSLKKRKRKRKKSQPTSHKNFLYLRMLRA